VAAVEDATKTDRLRNLGGVAGHSPVLSGTVFVGLLSLIGLPPLTGFFGKLFLAFDAAIRELRPIPACRRRSHWSRCSSVPFSRSCTRRACGSAASGGRETTAVETASVESGQVAVLVALAAAIVLVGVGFDPVYRFAGTAATAALDVEAYVDVVGLRG